MNPISRQGTVDGFVLFTHQQPFGTRPCACDSAKGLKSDTVAGEYEINLDTGEFASNGPTSLKKDPPSPK